MSQDPREYYLIFDIDNNSFSGLLTDDGIYALDAGYKAYKLTDEQVEQLNVIVKKKIKNLRFIDKVKLIFGLYK